MIDAKLMREIAFDKRDSEYHKLSDLVQYHIKRAAENGDFHIFFVVKSDDFSAKTTDTVMKHLRINGFSIMIQDVPDGKGVDISWE